MIQLCAVGPKVFVTETALPRDEMVLWQEGGQLLLVPETDARPYATFPYETRWEVNRPERVEARLYAPPPAGGQAFGRWTAAVEGERVALTFAVACPGPDPWPVVEAFFCYKHRSAPTFWDPELTRTYLEWEGEPATVRGRLEALHGAGAFWPKNHLHRRGFEEAFGRYERAGLRNPAAAGWASHRDATTGGWMAILAERGRWVSGLYWQGAEMLAQNGPDYGCLHAGARLARSMAPGERVLVRGALVLGAIGLEGFLERYRADCALGEEAL